MAAVIILLASLAFTAGFLSLFEYGVPDLLHATYDMLEGCESFFVKCVEYYYVFEVIFIWTGAVLLSAGLSYGVYRAVRRFIRTRRAVRNLPVAGAKGPVVLVRDGCGKIAFTHGMLRPKIYISTGLIRSLDRDELRVVFRHELHHVRNHDPLKFFMLAFLRDAFFYIPAVRYLAGVIRVKREHRADDSAAASGGHLTLASALVKVARSNTYVPQAHASFLGHGVKGSVEERIRRLVDARTYNRHGTPRPRDMAVSLFMTGILALTLLMPLNGRFEGFHECSLDHCDVHVDKTSQDCKMHCSIHEHKS